MIDLHLHSTHSDGTMTPSQLVKQAAGIGLSAISITDHDTVSATAEAIREGEIHSVEVIPGLEISSKYKGLDLHLLGYNFDWLNTELLKILDQLQSARKDRNKKIIRKLQEIGINITEQDLKAESGAGVAGRPHFARLLIKSGVVKNHQQAFSRYLKVGRCAYVPRFVLDIHDAIEILHGAGGLAVLAHPIQLSCSFSELSRIIKELKELGMDGLETYYPTQKGKKGKKIRELAVKYQLLETGGSDYHGDIRHGTSMAGGTGKFQVPAELLTKLKA
jgi:predicted metal-dependent phosphoesterase TrpH